MLWCERTANSSCSSRPISHSLAVIAAWSPMARPVRGSALRGISGTSWPGRIRASAFSRSCRVLALFRLMSTRRRSSPTASGASDVVSTPPAMPDSIWPRAILFATRIAASRPVPQACWTSYAGVVADSFEPKTLSRVRLKSRECLRTAPATTSPSCLPCRPKRATSPSSVAVSMSWLDACAYVELERANGIRFPPTIAALRVGADIGTSGVGGALDWPVLRVRGTVCHMKAEAVRPPSQENQPAAILRAQGNVAHAGDRRDSEPADTRDRRNSRWDEHRRNRREQLVEATLAAVEKHGAGVGMEEIAAEAGTSKTVVYRHFADRSELYVAVCNRVASQLLPKLRAAIESGSSHPRTMVAAAIDTYLAFIETDPQLYRFVVHQQTLDRPTSDPIDNLSDLVAQQAAAAISVALQQAGHDPAAAAPWGHGVVGLVRSAADWWLRAERPMLRTELAAHLTDLAWAGLSGVVTPDIRIKEEK